MKSSSQSSRSIESLQFEVDFWEIKNESACDLIGGYECVYEYKKSLGYKYIMKKIIRNARYRRNAIFLWIPVKALILLRKEGFKFNRIIYDLRPEFVIALFISVNW